MEAVLEGEAADFVAEEIEVGFDDDAAEEVDDAPEVDDGAALEVDDVSAMHWLPPWHFIPAGQHKSPHFCIGVLRSVEKS